MAKEQGVEDEEKKPGEDGEEAVSETILLRSHNPGEEKLAEAALKHFIRDRLEQWYHQMESSIDNLEAFILQQNQDDQKLYSERGFFDSLGDRFQGELFHLAGGKGTPIMDALASEVDFTVGFAEHSTFNISIFLNEMRRGVRDACWYMRDACQAVLSNQWADLLDLATQGSLEFIPVLFQMGLPSEKFGAKHMTEKLTHHTEQYKKANAPMKEQAEEKASDKGVNEAKQAEAEEEANQIDEEELDAVRKESQSAVA